MKSWLITQREEAPFPHVLDIKNPVDRITKGTLINSTVVS